MDIFYINSFNKFLLKQVKLDKNSRILDIGCGRGKIIANLSFKLKLLNKPIGLDIENHKDRSKKIIFKNIDALSYISKTKYLEMINNRYISTLLNFTDNQIIKGLNEIMKKYKKILKFKDRLVCFVIKNN